MKSYVQRTSPDASKIARDSVSPACDHHNLVQLFVFNGVLLMLIARIVVARRNDKGFKNSHTNKFICGLIRVVNPYM